MSQTTTPAYWVGIMAVLVAAAASLVFYQVFYLPENLLRPSVDDHILHPDGQTQVSIVPGSNDASQQDNYMPKILNLQLGIDNHVIWTNDDDTAHAITSHHRHEDAYSGSFGSEGVILPGDTYEFLFTEDTHMEYHCFLHPWMMGVLEVTK